MAREDIRSGPAARPVSIRLTRGERLGLDEIAQREGTTSAAIVRRAIKREIRLSFRRTGPGYED